MPDFTINPPFGSSNDDTSANAAAFVPQRP